MKILRIVPSMNPESGGVAESIKQSAILMKEENIDIEVVCFDREESLWINEFNFKVHALGKGFSSYAFKFNYLIWMIKNVKNYDLVIIDGLWMFHVVGGYVCKLKEIPFIIYSHGMLDPYFNKNRKKYFKKIPFWFLVERNIISFAKNIVFTCKEEMTLAEKSFPFFKGNGVVATLGIETTKKNKNELMNLFHNNFPQLSDNRNFLFLSRIHEKKGLELLIDTIKSIHPIILKNNIKILIAGTGEEKYIKTLKDRIKKNDLENTFEWLGMLTGDLKWSVFASSEIFILPSHQENFGIVIAEALSMSLPILTTNKVNIWNEIIEHHAGFIQDDTEKGIEKLLTIYINLSNEEKIIMQNNALKCFNDKFSKNAFKNDFKKVINLGDLK